MVRTFLSMQLCFLFIDRNFRRGRPITTHKQPARPSDQTPLLRARLVRQSREPLWGTYRAEATYCRRAASRRSFQQTAACVCVLIVELPSLIYMFFFIAGELRAAFPSFVSVPSEQRIYQRIFFNSHP